MTFTGVTWDKTRLLWLARITVNKKQIFLGRFIRLSDAILWRKVANIEY